MLSIALPKGSLEHGALDLFDRAGMKVRRRSLRSLRADVAHPEITGVRFHKPQEIPDFVERGIYDLGITGGGWIMEENAQVDVLGRLPDSAWSSEVSTTTGSGSCAVQAVVAETTATRLMVEVSEAGAVLVSESPVLRVARGH